MKKQKKTKKLLGVSNTAKKPTRRANHAWREAYTVRDEELLISKHVPTSGTVMGLGDQTFSGTRRKVFVVSTTLWFRGAKPTTIITLSDGR